MRTKLGQIEFPLPSLTEQERIVGILDQAFQGVDEISKNAANILVKTTEFFDILIKTLVDDASGPLESMTEICSIPYELVDPRLAPYKGLPHIGAGNIIPRTGELSDVLIAEEENLISPKFLFDMQAVLYSKIRPYLMKVARPEKEGLCSADMYPLKPAKNVHKDYLYYLLLSPAFTEYAVAGSARAGMPKVNRDHLFKFETALPTLAEQRRIVQVLEDANDLTRQLERNVRSKLDELDSFKKSLLHEAFAGKL